MHAKAQTQARPTGRFACKFACKTCLRSLRAACCASSTRQGRMQSGAGKEACHASKERLQSACTFHSGRVYGLHNMEAWQAHGLALAASQRASRKACKNTRLRWESGVINPFALLLTCPEPRARGWGFRVNRRRQLGPAFPTSLVLETEFRRGRQSFGPVCIPGCCSPREVCRLALFCATFPLCPPP